MSGSSATTMAHSRNVSTCLKYRPLTTAAFLDEAPPTSTLHDSLRHSFEPRYLAGRHQAVRPWCLLTQDIATSSKGVFPWRTKNRANRRTAPIP